MSTDPCGSKHVTPTINPRTSISQSEMMKITQPIVNSLKVMETYFRNEQLTDVVLVTGDQRIPAHRLVLSATSNYFETMFKNSMSKSTQEEIILTEVDGDALSALVEYCYTGTIEWPEENIDSLLKTASLLQLNAVVEVCCQYLVDRLDSENCLGFMKLANNQWGTKLQSAALAHALKHFMDVMRNREFLCLSSEEVAKLLESEDIIVPSEETVFHALMEWIQHDVENRADDAGKLLSCIKLPLLSPAFINEHITSNELFRSQKTAQNLIIEALMSHLLPENKAALIRSGRARPRKSTVDGDVLLAIGQKSIDAFFPKDNVWKEVASTSDERKWFCSAFVEDKLVVMGGYIANRITDTVKSFDFTSLSWNTLSPMNTPRESFGAAVLDGLLYAVGGSNGSGFLNTVERWDPVTQRWSYVAPLSTQRHGVSVAVFNNKLYAAGGLVHGNAVSIMECYDPHTNEWTVLAPMDKPRYLTGIGVINEYLYVLGGYHNNDVNFVERYDPQTNTWSSVAPLSVASRSVGVGVIGGRLFAVGQTQSLAEAYDPDLNEWQKFSPLEVDGPKSCVAVKNSVLKLL